MRARRIEAARVTRGRRKQLIEDITEQLEQALTRDHIEGKVIGREKHLYSIIQKCEKRKVLSDIMDIFAFRVIVDDGRLPRTGCRSFTVQARTGRI